jgi:hypothetical protein
MKKNLLILMVLNLMALAAFAQEPVLNDNQFKGHIIKANGETEEGILELRGGQFSPWANQTEVKFISLEKFTSGQVKKKDWTAYSPKQISGYSIGEKTFVSQKYANMAAVGPDMLARMYFIEKVVDGKLTIYRFYETPLMMASGPNASAELEASQLQCRNHPQVLVQKDGGKVKGLGEIDITKYIDDNAEVLEKYNTGGYGFLPKKGEKKGLGGMIAQSDDNETLKQYIVTIAQEYNGAN